MIEHPTVTVKPPLTRRPQAHCRCPCRMAPRPARRISTIRGPAATPEATADSTRLSWTPTSITGCREHWRSFPEEPDRSRAASTGPAEAGRGGGGGGGETVDSRLPHFVKYVGNDSLAWLWGRWTEAAGRNGWCPGAPATPAPTRPPRN